LKYDVRDESWRMASCGDIFEREGTTSRPIIKMIHLLLTLFILSVSCLPSERTSQPGNTAWYNSTSNGIITCHESYSGCNYGYCYSYAVNCTDFTGGCEAFSGMWPGRTNPCGGPGTPSDENYVGTMEFADKQDCSSCSVELTQSWTSKGRSVTVSSNSVPGNTSDPPGWKMCDWIALKSLPNFENSKCKYPQEGRPCGTLTGANVGVNSSIYARKAWDYTLFVTNPPSSAPYKCIQSCDAQDLNHYVLARTTPRWSPSFSGCTPQCAGPDMNRCSWYLDSQCTQLAPNEPAPVVDKNDVNGFLGLQCKSQYQQGSPSWCQRFEFPRPCPSPSLSFYPTSMPSMTRPASIVEQTSSEVTATGEYYPHYDPTSEVTPTSQVIRSSTTMQRSSSRASYSFSTPLAPRPVQCWEGHTNTTSTSSLVKSQPQLGVCVIYQYGCLPGTFDEICRTYQPGTILTVYSHASECGGVPRLMQCCSTDLCNGMSVSNLVNPGVPGSAFKLSPWFLLLLAFL
jgi:hypothetical protein